MTPNTKKTLRRQIEVSAIFKNLFESVEGQKVMDYLKYRFFVGRSTIDNGPVDANRLIFNEGSRAVILHIQGLIDMDLTEAHEILEIPDQDDAEYDLAT